MISKNSLRLAGLALITCALAACGDDDPRFAQNRTDYITGTVNEHGVSQAYNQHASSEDSVSYWDGDGVPGNPHIDVKLAEQRAYFYKGDQLVGISQVSTGREGFNTPTGNFKVLQKDKDHRSSLYGDYVDAKNPTTVVKANVENGKDPRPPGNGVSRLVDAELPAGFQRRRPAHRLSAGRAGEPRMHPDAGLHVGKFL